MEEVDREPSGVKVADSIVKRNVAIDAHVGSVSAERHKRERAGVDCDGVADNIRSASVNESGAQRNRWRCSRVVTGSLQEQLVYSFTLNNGRFRGRFRQPYVILVTIEQLDPGPCGADHNRVIPAAPPVGPGTERKPIMLGGPFQTASRNLKSTPRIVTSGLRRIGLHNMEAR